MTERYTSSEPFSTSYVVVSGRSTSETPRGQQSHSNPTMSQSEIPTSRTTTTRLPRPPTTRTKAGLYAASCNSMPSQPKPDLTLASTGTKDQNHADSAPFWCQSSVRSSRHKKPGRCNPTFGRRQRGEYRPVDQITNVAEQRLNGGLSESLLVLCCLDTSWTAWIGWA